MTFKGYKGHPRDFVPPGADEHTRRIQYKDVEYNIVEVQGTVYVRISSSYLSCHHDRSYHVLISYAHYQFHPQHAPDQTLAILRDPRGVTEIEMTPLGLAHGNDFIEHVLLVAVLYQSGVPFRDKVPISGAQYGMWAAQGAIAANFAS
jgi:hypothetical protein